MSDALCWVISHETIHYSSHSSKKTNDCSGVFVDSQSWAVRSVFKLDSLIPFRNIKRLGSVLNSSLLFAYLCLAFSTAWLLYITTLLPDSLDVCHPGGIDHGISGMLAFLHFHNSHLLQIFCTLHICYTLPKPTHTHTHTKYKMAETDRLAGQN